MAILFSAAMDFGSTMVDQLNPSKIHAFPRIYVSSLKVVSNFTSRLPSLTLKAYQPDSEKLSFLSDQGQPMKSVLVQSPPMPETDNFKEPDPKTQSLEIFEARKSGTSKSKEKANEIQTSVDPLQVLKYPLTTDSAIKQITDENTLVFIVDVRANKKTIKSAFENTFDIKSKRVNTLINFDGTKKAFITLSPDYNALDVAKKIKIL